MSTLPIYPFDADRSIGTVIEVLGNIVKVNLPQAAAPGSRWHHGHQLEAGRVGEFVVVESGHTAVFGRITGVRLPERERLSVEEDLGGKPDVHPIGMVSLVASVDLATGKIEPGVPHHPRLGARCFSAHPLLIKWLAESSRFTGDEEAKLLTLATLPFSTDTLIRVAPESLFGRHCAVLGATGGGKSWTLARLVEEVGKHQSKVLLIDPTGEFHTITGDHVTHAHINKDQVAEDRGSVETCVPFTRLQEADLFALFQPAPQSQAPKLRGAIKSLKLLHHSKRIQADPTKYEQTQVDAANGLMKQVGTQPTVQKANVARAPFETASRSLAPLVDGPAATFDIARLADQIQNECCWPTGKGADAHKFGGVHDGDLGYCINLVTRVEQLVASSEFACIFKPAGKKDFLTDVLKPFLDDNQKTTLILSLRELSFSNNIREILVNAIGRYLLIYGRRKNLVNSPLVVVLDEAHQFIGKAIGEEFAKLKLDAFELIAKEGRKYALTICLSTQRPRDIGQGILSQMGAYLVHRLTNPEDRDIVEKAAGELDRSAAAFIPTLAAGQAILIGTDFPIPVTLQMIPPGNPPESSGPKYQEVW
ncbi:MAG TPA: ATP-binding protein [Fimbriimonadaceae bacterium]|nr:ATP-binding protein [Fimbriimonadaceae bacterium]HRJ32487.1 ATP-binding protein [Fimbriimonadaceae bacterium]